MIVPNTLAMLWWANGERAQLSAAAASTIDAEMDGDQILVSSMSSWELAMLVERGRVAPSMDIASWLDTLSRIDAVRMVPVDSEIAVKSVQLPGDFHKDPADRIIVATARKFAAPLVSADEKIRSYPHVRAIW